MLLIASFLFCICGLINLNVYLSKIQPDKELLDRYRNIICWLLAVSVLMLIPLISKDPNIISHSYVAIFLLLITLIPALVLDKGVKMFTDSYRESSIFILIPFLCLLWMYIVYYFELKNENLTGSPSSRSTSSGYRYLES